MTYRSIRREVFNFLDPQSRRTGPERLGNALISLLILANVLAVILESMPAVHDGYGAAFDRFETLSVVIFTVESPFSESRRVSRINDARHPLLGRLRFAISPLALIDLAVILPVFLPGEYFLDLRFARIVRVIRMLRILKLTRYSETLRTFGAVFRAKRIDIGLMTLFLLILVVLSSSLMYFVEHPEQPDKFSSIPAAMWWSVMTLTTVGYGDIFPITPLGKFIGALIALMGIGFFALPAGVLAAAFAEELAKKRTDSPKVCPHCGEAIE